MKTEDYVVQPSPDVSPPKWHLAHTTWFFEAFVLCQYYEGFKVFRKDYHLLFNSYYISAGDRWTRADRGNLTRPTVEEVIEYRCFVDAQIEQFLCGVALDDEMIHVLEVGLQHEQQHQELLIYDIKYILGHNPTFPVYKNQQQKTKKKSIKKEWLNVSEGVYEIGHGGEGYCFDNELGVHKQFLHEFAVQNVLITNAEYLEFILSGGYKNHSFWLSEGWDWINNEGISAPLYWFEENSIWHEYTLGGLVKLDLDAPVSHVSFYEADAFAKWKGYRLPTEFEWEVVSKIFQPVVGENSNFVENGHFRSIRTGELDFLGNLWEWTSSAYRPYPYYQIPEGALGEYNGKFMMNQMVLRGGSFATPQDHIRHTYRNFFQPQSRWMSSGIRLAKHI